MKPTSQLLAETLMQSPTFRKMALAEPVEGSTAGAPVSMATKVVQMMTMYEGQCGRQAIGEEDGRRELARQRFRSSGPMTKEERELCCILEAAKTAALKAVKGEETPAEPAPIKGLTMERAEKLTEEVKKGKLAMLAFEALMPSKEAQEKVREPWRPVKITSTEELNKVAATRLDYLRQLVEEALQGPMARAVRADIINPALRAQGEVFAGSGQGIQEILQNALGGVGAGGSAVARGLAQSNVPDYVAPMGLGLVGGGLLQQLTGNKTAAVGASLQDKIMRLMRRVGNATTGDPDAQQFLREQFVNPFMKAQGEMFAGSGAAMSRAGEAASRELLGDTHRVTQFLKKHKLPDYAAPVGIGMGAGAIGHSLISD